MPLASRAVRRAVRLLPAARPRLHARLGVVKGVTVPPPETITTARVPAEAVVGSSSAAISARNNVSGMGNR